MTSKPYDLEVVTEMTMMTTFWLTFSHYFTLYPLLITLYPLPIPFTFYKICELHFSFSLISGGGSRKLAKKEERYLRG